MWLMQFFKAGFHFALSFLKGVLSFIAPPIMRALESLAEIIGVRKNETIEDRVKFEYEAHHGPGSLWFSGETERKKDETSTNYLARRYSQAIGGLMAANEVKKIRKQYIKANAGRIVFTGAVTGAIVALALTSFQGWLQLWAVAAAAVVLIALSTLWYIWNEKPSLGTLAQAGLSKEQVQKIAQLTSEIFTREQAIDAPDDLKDIYRIPFLDKNGNPVSGRFFESDLTEDYYAAEIWDSHFFTQLAFAGFLALSSLAGVFVSSFFLMPDVLHDIESTLTLAGTFSLIYLVGLCQIVWHISRYKLKTESTQAASHRSEILESLSQGSSDQLALQSGISAAILQENKARDEQIAIAKADKSPFFELGRSTGFFHQRYDQFAPSVPGLPVGLTFNDLSTHLLVLGGTGAGKTSGTIRPLIRQWLANDQGGMLVLDGKGQLPAEIQSENYTLLTPGKIELNPIEGLRPDDVAETIENLANDSGQGADPYWTNAAAKLIRSIAHTVYALSEKGDMPYNLASLYAMLSDERVQGQARKNLTDDFVAQLSGSARRGIRYALHEFRAMPEKQRGSIEGIASLWLSQITDNEEMASWAEAVSGYPIETVTTGARIGVLLPEARYGKAGVLVSGLLKKRVYEAIKRRGDTWQKEEGQTAVLVVIDEVQELLTDDETRMLPIARSLGLYATFSTQNVDGILTKLGDHAGYQLLGNLRSLIAFQTQTQSTTKYISERMGASYRPKIHNSDCYEDTYTRVRKLAEAGISEAKYNQKIGIVSGVGTIGLKIAALPSLAIRALKDPELRWRSPERYGDEWTNEKGIRENIEIDMATNVERYGRSNQLIELTPNVSTEEVNEILSQPNTAFCQVMRGRVVRRDLIVTKPIYEMGE